MRNPLDYSIWSILANKVYKVKIQNVEHLCQRLEKAWDEITQGEISRSIAGFWGCALHQKGNVWNIN